jgi:hypothetical protein
VALSDRGLTSALESLAAACETPVTLDVRAVELPEQVELAAYFIVSEALTNANKHAARARSGSASHGTTKCSGWRSPTTAAVAQTPPAAQGCTDSPSASTRSVGDSKSTARPA